MNPMVDGWMGDDWFHNGAFRAAEHALHLRAGGHARQRGEVVDQQLRRLRHVHGRPARRANWAAATGWSRSASGARCSSIPATTPSGSSRRWTRVLAARAAEGAGDAGAQPVGPGGHLRRNAVYKAIKPKDTDNDKVFLVLGPWHHGQEIEDGSTLGAIKFGSDTALYFRRDILRPFLDAVPEGRCAAGRHRAGDGVRDRHQRVAALPAWPAGCAERLHSAIRRRFICSRDRSWASAAPEAGDAAYDEYVSDPAKPVPYPRAADPADGL